MNTEICRAFRNNGSCRYGEECRFVHSVGEPIARPPPGLCFDFRDEGVCSRGDSCRFMHGENDPRFKAGADGVLQRASPGRECTVCGNVYNRDDGQFSKNQWNNREGRRCKDCIATQQDAVRSEREANRSADSGGDGGGGGKKRRNRKPRDRANGACWNCGGMDHISRDCPMEKNSSNEFAECFNCRAIGHISRDCQEPCRRCNDSSHSSADCPLRVQREDQAAY